MYLHVNEERVARKCGVRPGKGFGKEETVKTTHLDGSINLEELSISKLSRA